MVKLTFSKHAAKRMFERDIGVQEVTLTVETPDYKIVRGYEIEAYKKFAGETLKVIYEKTESFIKVVTVVWI
jgi:hypothetical protein